MATFKKKEQTKPKSFLDTVAPIPMINPSTPVQPTQTPKESVVTPKPSQYKPQRYNEKTGKVEDVGPGIRNTNVSRKEINRQSADFNTSQIEKRMMVQEQAQQAQAQEAINTNPVNAIVGELDPSIVNDYSDPLTQDILANLEGQQRPFADYSGTPGENARYNSISILSRLANPAVKILDKVSFGTKLGTAIVDELAVNDDVKRTINRFNTGDDVKQIRDNLANAEELRKKALSQAQTDPVNAALNYREAQSRKYKSYLQMRAISQNDPKQFLELKKELEALEIYFDSKNGIKKMDDDALLLALGVQ